MLAMIRDLMAHKSHANAELLDAVRDNDAAAADVELRGLLDHILIANRFWLLTILRLPFDLEHESTARLSFDRLLQAYRTNRQQEAEWLATASEADLERILEGAMIPGGRCSVSQALMQVCMHSHGHRAQCAKLLRRHGGVAPTTDFILWLADRPTA